MKKATMIALVNYLNDMIGMNGGEAYTDEFIVNARDEMTAELAKDQTRKDANAQTYELVKPLVFENLTTDTPVTLAELWEAVKDDVPGDFTKGKLQHAMTRVWVDELEKHEGKVNSYTLKG